jgi:hypothetical protein
MKSHYGWIISAQKNQETRSQLYRTFKESVAALEKQLGSTLAGLGTRFILLSISIHWEK